MDPHLVFINPVSPLLSKIKKYRKVAAQFQSYLKDHPDDWGGLQSEFNQEINGIFRDIMIYEKEKILEEDFEAIVKFKHFFKEKLEKYFSYGEYIRWSQRKPYGYTGDFVIMENIYNNQPRTKGFDRLFDNFMQMSTISIAVRNRKDDFKSIIEQELKRSKSKNFHIMCLACGPSRELRELLQEKKINPSKVSVDCIDHDPRALKFSKSFCKKMPSFRFKKMNAVRLALMKNVRKAFDSRYDLIYCTGLFDYLDERVSVRLLKNLKALLLPGGTLAVSDVQDKFSNPSLPFMELVGLWDLTYRDPEDFRRYFTECGFKPKQLSYQYEQQGIMQYVIARNK